MICNKGFIWNPSNCECGCDKSCNIGEYLDYSSCKCRKRSVSWRIYWNINETSLVKKNLDKSEDRCNSYAIYKALFWTFFIFFLISIGISICFVYCNYVIRNKYDLTY